MTRVFSSGAIALLFFACLAFYNPTYAQTTEGIKCERKISFPDIPGFQTIICDFHQHTVFSDGLVWPDIRVLEALNDGLGAISITDHLEYQPHKNDIPFPDRNRVYKIAKEAAKDKNLLVINGAEITRSMPPGHANAIFITDANKLLDSDSIAVYREARRQGAFIFWNHPHWVAQNKNGTSLLTEIHRQLIREGLINGIEVVNENTYSDEALQIALDNNLTIMGSSDIHRLVSWEYKASEGEHRPVTLVFATERTENGIKSALENRRTAVWFKNTLIGLPEYLVPLINQSLIVKSTKVIIEHDVKTNVVSVDIENLSDADYILENQKDFTFYNQPDIFIMKAHNTFRLQVKTLKVLPTFDLRFRVLNAIIAPNTHPVVALKVNANWN
jgi:hypothetical protein